MKNNGFKECWSTWLLKLSCSLIVVLLISGCGSSSPDRMVLTEFHPFTPEELAMRSKITAAKYRINPGDILEFDFKYQDELDKSNVLILPDGRFAMSGVDDVNAVGMTTSELDSVLTAAFAVDYRNPELTVIVQKLGPSTVYVFGEVGKPGGYEIHQSYTGVLQAISLAGGFTNSASRAEVLVISMTAEGYMYRIADISHLEAYSPAGLAQINIQGNDIIYVPRSTLGDIKVFSDSFLQAAQRVTDIFWDIYAISHLEKVTNLTR